MQIQVISVDVTGLEKDPILPYPMPVQAALAFRHSTVSNLLQGPCWRKGKCRYDLLTVGHHRTGSLNSFFVLSSSF